MNKRMVIFQACLFIIGTFCMAANACPCPPCYSGTYPNCVYNCNSSNCETCVGGGCVSSCNPANCETCVGGSCVSSCNPANCETCAGGSCVSSCNPANCETCVGGSCVSCCDPAQCETCVGGECKVCGGDATKCCVNGVCMSTCIPEGGDMCTYTPPPAADPLCTFESPDWPYCQNPGASCAWVAVEGPYRNAICRLGCSCSLGSTYCVKLEPKQCKTMLFWLPPFVHCQCEAAEGLVVPVTRGTRSICSTP